MIDRYQITYDFCEERDIIEYFDGTYIELLDYLNQMRKKGCHNFDCVLLYSYETVLGE